MTMMIELARNAPPNVRERPDFPTVWNLMLKQGLDSRTVWKKVDEVIEWWARLVNGAVIESPIDVMSPGGARFSRKRQRLNALTLSSAFLTKAAMGAG
jgi:hypothetical protein